MICEVCMKQYAGEHVCGQIFKGCRSCLERRLSYIHPGKASMLLAAYELVPFRILLCFDKSKCWWCTRPCDWGSAFYNRLGIQKSLFGKRYDPLNGEHIKLKEMLRGTLSLG